MDHLTGSRIRLRVKGLTPSYPLPPSLLHSRYKTIEIAGGASQSPIERPRIHPFKMDFKILAISVFALAAAEASVISDFLRYQKHCNPLSRKHFNDK